MIRLIQKVIALAISVPAAVVLTATAGMMIAGYVDLRREALEDSARDGRTGCDHQHIRLAAGSAADAVNRVTVGGLKHLPPHPAGEIIESEGNRDQVRFGSLGDPAGNQHQVLQLHSLDCSPPQSFLQ